MFNEENKTDINVKIGMHKEKGMFIYLPLAFNGKRFKLSSPNDKTVTLVAHPDGLKVSSAGGGNWTRIGFSTKWLTFNAYNSNVSEIITAKWDGEMLVFDTPVLQRRTGTKRKSPVYSRVKNKPAPIAKSQPHTISKDTLLTELKTTLERANTIANEIGAEKELDDNKNFICSVRIGG
jgi:hypothetical protein